MEVLKLSCPICGSNSVKAEKVHDGNKWWHRCVSGLDHSGYIFKGKEYSFDEYPYFNGVSISTENGVLTPQ